jgi:mannose-6-phosphate isomerase-like protein (cupin superfamily)
LKKEIIPPKRGTPLRKNGARTLEILLNGEYYESTLLINGTSFITRKISNDDLLVKPNDYYMIINIGDEETPVYYSEDITELEIIYDPYRYEDSEKINFKPEDFKGIYDVPEGYIDTLPKWYSFKFTYSDYNLIFVRPGLGISIQDHVERNEFWEILEGTPILINGNDVHYFIENNTKFEIPIGTYHSVINPNSDKFVIIRESWSGYFDEEDINRAFNPNNYK